MRFVSRFAAVFALAMSSAAAIAAEPINILVDRATSATTAVERSKATKSIAEQIKDGAKLSKEDAEKCRAMALAFAEKPGAVRSHCAIILTKVGDESCVPTLAEMLQDSNVSVRLTAGEALGNIGSDEAVPALTAAAIEHQQHGIAFLDALVKIGSPAAKSGMEKILKESRDQGGFTKSVQKRLASMSNSKRPKAAKSRYKSAKSKR